MSDNGRRPRSRQIWRLHLPLVVALTICTAATVIEFNRATDGVGRAWAYTVQWPLFGAFAVWMWVRYRREERGEAEGARSRTRQRARKPWDGLVEGWRSNVAAAERSAQIADDDPDLLAWRRHVVDLRRQESAREGQPGSD